MNMFGPEELQKKYRNHHIDDECKGHWKQITGPDMPYKIDDGITVMLLNPPLIACDDCGVQFFAEGFEKKMHRAIVRAMLFDHRPLTGSQIRFVRSFAGFSQTEVARELDIRNEALSRYESRKDPQTMQPGEQVRFKLLLISKLGFEIPKDAQLWKADKASLVAGSDSLIRKIDAATLRSEAS